MPVWTSPFIELQRKLLVDGFVEVPDELVELAYAEKRGNQLRALCGRSSCDPRERVDAILLDETESKGVGVGGQRLLAVLASWSTGSELKHHVS
ncbi:hypothetical protein [Roseateles sp.]|uniref:hypothetical protein n=1 Tax=Roseateles sp. TaxID=1971397 RepID=UPI003D09E0A6